MYSWLTPENTRCLTEMEWPMRRAPTVCLRSKAWQLTHSDQHVQRKTPELAFHSPNLRTLSLHRFKAHLHRKYLWAARREPTDRPNGAVHREDRTSERRIRTSEEMNALAEQDVYIRRWHLRG
ncbi:hypothetical protein TNCV_1501061 [Trichonephila clavipes]|uniref:Uncharacterized protein n=1 Tax=Trichonephila clavipes TaxID=2585209 RepID=A0A8X6RPD3_TRICX|nr:hypothetical protein TNCV_1501061 [Trichonephila clavipes]